MKFIRRYRAFIITIIITGILLIVNNVIGMRAIGISFYTFKEMLTIIPPIFILLGLLDVWVPREVMIKYMGDDSGIKGVVLAILIGSAAAGPLYGAFPVAAVFMKKGVKFSNILIFIGAWSTTKIPLVLFEASTLGVKFALTRLLIDIPGIIIIAFILSKIMTKDEVAKIYINAEEMDNIKGKAEK
ncbi:MAG: permease [Saccharofermentanales bacterium]